MGVVRKRRGVLEDRVVSRPNLLIPVEADLPPLPHYPPTPYLFFIF